MTRGVSRGAWAAAAFATAAIVVAGIFPVHNSDTFGHLAQGRQIAELGYVPAVDHFSFWKDEPAPWHNYEWGSDLVTWLVYSTAGANGLLFLKCLLLGLMAVLLFRRAADARRTAELSVILTAGLLLWAIPAARFRLTMRPEIFGYALCALYLVGLGRLAAGGLAPRARVGWLVGLIVAHVAWVNLHGSHLLGVVFAAAHLVPVFRMPGPRRDVLVLLGGFALASCVSPYGPAIVTDALAHVVDPAFREAVREWAPWQATDPVFYMVALVIQSTLLAAAAIPLYRGNVHTRAGLVTATLLGIAGFRSIRFIAIFLLFSAPLLAPGLARILRIRLRRRAVGAALALVGVGAVVSLVYTRDLAPGYGVETGIDDRQLPVVAGHVLESDLGGGRVLAPIQTSWYLMFASPSSRFLMDGRVPFYGVDHIREVARALPVGPSRRSLP